MNSASRSSEYNKDVQVAPAVQGKKIIFKAEKHLLKRIIRESEELNYLILSNISETVFITDNQGFLTFISPNVERMFGYSCHEAQELAHIDQLLGDNLFQWQELETREEIQDIEREIKDKADRSHTLLINVKLLVHQGGILYTCRDISKYQKTEQSQPITDYQIQASNELEQRVRERTAELTSANQVLEKEVKKRKQVEEALQLLGQQEREKAQQLELTIKNIKKTQALLVQREKMNSLGQLVAGIAHEINNPLSFIYGNINPAKEYAQELLSLLRLYQQYYPQPPAEIVQELNSSEPGFIAQDFPKLLTSMQEGADRICQIVKSLKNFSCFDETKLKRVDIHQSIDNTLLIVQHRLKQQPKGSEIKLVKNYGKLPLVEYYPGSLNQVLMNLLSNAIDALEEATASQSDLSPMIEIRTELKQDSLTQGEDSSLNSPTQTETRRERTNNSRVVIRIRNNGPGIAAEVQPRIFDPFFTTKPPGKGIGLGLSTSYRIIVDRHGGQLKCHSMVEQGTEFVIELPISQLQTG
ncbi:MAG: ATP-binding protein [Coleofasciculaceae cyanobacterium]